MAKLCQKYSESLGICQLWFVQAFLKRRYALYIILHSVKTTAGFNRPIQ